jgi:hypothetical protein
VSFQPVAGAKDYRIFPLPAAADVLVDGTGFVTVRNATYRCAGDRLAVRAALDQGAGDQGNGVNNGWTSTFVDHDVQGVVRAQADATLGYVYLDPAPDRVAVYSLGGAPLQDDNVCMGEIWAASREKVYTSSEVERTTLLAQGWRDDGVAFYAPIAGDVQVESVSTSGSFGYRLYFAGGTAEATARAALAPTGVFTALSAPSSTGDTEPLMRVYYNGACSRGHDELVAGEGGFERIRTQGNQPVFEVQWAGLSQDTTLVVEALDSGCPFQGFLSPAPVDFANGSNPTQYLNPQHFDTIEELRQASATGEVFVNGEHEAGNRPRAIARSFVQVKPSALAGMEWSDSFPAGDPGPVFTETLPPAWINPAGWNVYLTSDRYDAQYYNVEFEGSQRAYGLGVVDGELWSSMADWGSDTTGKFRLTPRKLATLSAGAYLHATMTTDLWSTGRRYPQLIISDQPSPVQDHMSPDHPEHATGTTLLLQTRGRWPFELELQLCTGAHAIWDVNNQCQRFHFDASFGDASWPAHPWVGEISGAPLQLKRLDLYVSTRRAYVFLESQPYACANLPAAPAAGPVTVTFGDTLYHSGVDEPVVQAPYGYTFLLDHQLRQTSRHYDNLGFDSGVGPPPWDEARFPCTSTLETPP